MRSAFQRKGRPPLAGFATWRLPKFIDTHYKSLLRALARYGVRKSCGPLAALLTVFIVLVTVMLVVAVQQRVLLVGRGQRGSSGGIFGTSDDDDSGTDANGMVITDALLLTRSSSDSGFSSDSSSSSESEQHIGIARILNQSVIASIDDDDVDDDPEYYSALVNVVLTNGQPALCRLLLLTVPQCVKNAHSDMNMNKDMNKPCNRSIVQTPSLSSLAGMLSIRDHLIPRTVVTQLSIPLDSKLGTRPVIRAVQRRLRVSHRDVSPITAAAIALPYAKPASLLDLPSTHPHTWSSLYPTSRHCTNENDDGSELSERLRRDEDANGDGDDDEQELMTRCTRVRDTLLVLYIAGCETVQASDAVVVSSDSSILSMVAQPARCWGSFHTSTNSGSSESERSNSSYISENITSNNIMEDVWKKYVMAIHHSLFSSKSSEWRRNIRTQHRMVVQQYREDMGHIIRSLNMLARARLSWGISVRAKRASGWLRAL